MKVFYIANKTLSDEEIESAFNKKRYLFDVPPLLCWLILIVVFFILTLVIAGI